MRRRHFQFFKELPIKKHSNLLTDLSVDGRGASFTWLYIGGKLFPIHTQIAHPLPVTGVATALGWVSICCR